MAPIVNAFGVENTRKDDNSIIDILSGNAPVQVETELKITWRTVAMFMVLIIAGAIASRFARVVKS